MSRFMIPGVGIVDGTSTYVEPRSRQVPKYVDGTPVMEEDNVTPVMVAEDDSLSHVVGLLPDDELARLGITKVVEHPRPDRKFYDSEEDPNNPGAWLSTPKSITDIRANLAARINADAANVILAVFPDWKQRNMTAAGVDLLDKMRSRPLTSEEQALKDSLSAAWAWIEAVRGHSNDLQAEVDAATFEQLTTWQPHDWPAAPG